MVKFILSAMRKANRTGRQGELMIGGQQGGYDDTVTVRVTVSL